jgi:hypothetical protein
MAPKNGRLVIPAGRRGVAGAAVAVLLGSAGLAGCGLGKAVNAVQKVTQAVAANKATIDQFTSSMKSGSPTTFEATYVTTGKSPTTVLYAVRQPKGLVFRETPSSGSGVAAVDVVVNSSGEYSCSPPEAGSGSGSGSRWSCQKLGTADKVVENQILDFYTPGHWAAFLREFSLAAGFAGDKVRSSHLTVHGFSMRCVDFVAAGVTGTSKICTTSQGILGYVKVASEAGSFEIKSYSTSPPASLFRLPRGATVTKSAAGAS